MLSRLINASKNFIFVVLLFPSIAQSDNQGNQTISSFSQSKKTLLKKVFYDRRITIYCGARFDKNKNITLPEGFVASIYKKRATRVEWEHVVPAENFGRAFKEWREGDDICVSSKGKPYRGRKCADKASLEYRYMQADMYNLFPSVGAVNAARQNYNFVMLSDNSKSDFGSCDMRIEGNKAQPPERARGRIARTYMYMDMVYPKYSMSKQQRKLMEAWDKQYPIEEFECIRNKRIKAIQKNINPILDKQCES